MNVFVLIKKFIKTLLQLYTISFEGNIIVFMDISLFDELNNHAWKIQ